MYTETLYKILDYAQFFARNNNETALESKHILYALSCMDNEAQKYLNAFGLTKQRLQPRTKGQGGVMHDSQEFLQLKTMAGRIANILQEPMVTCVHVLIALLCQPRTYANEKLVFLLGEQGKTTTDLLNYILKDLPNGNLLKDIKGDNTPAVSNDEYLDGQSQQNNFQLFQAQQDDYSNNEVATQTIPYGIDLTEKATSGKYDMIVGRDLELERVIQTLTRKTKNNPVLVGEPGVGKTAVVEGLASAIAKGHVPSDLQCKRLIQLDIAGMVAGTRYRGDFEERLTNVINKVIACGDVILFIDEIHNMVGAGGTGDGAMDAAEILKPALARGELHVIGATTTKEYRQYIEKDPALERRFQPITVAEPTPEVAVEIIKSVKDKYEKHHDVTITDQAIETAVQLSVRYVTDRYLPDKAFDIIDEACSKLKISAFSVPQRLQELSAKITELKRKRKLAEGVRDFDKLNQIDSEIKDATYEFEYEQAEQQTKLQQYKCTLQPNDVCIVVSQMTGVPVSELSKEEKDKLVHLEEDLSKKVIGQSQAVKVVSLAVRRQRAGLKDPNRPIGSFIFVGPTGVGKTELAKALSECLFGSNSEVIRIDMSEYMDKQSSTKLIGAPAGYVGYDEGGYLTDKVRTKPYSVVLFDEIEKAHPDVFNLLLQILDEGRLTDSHGKTVDFRNTVIILTSNIGVTDNGAIGFGNSQDNLKANVDSALKKFFRPELLNRLDEIVVFNYLSESEIEEIAKLLCFSLCKRLKNTINLKFTGEAIKHIASVGYDHNYGARPLKRAIQKEVEDALAEKILLGEINTGDTVVVDEQMGKIVFNKN